MKAKIYNLLLIITSLFGFLEWSGDSSAFLFQAEAEIVVKLLTQPGSVVHPFILFPLAAQLLLVFTLFQQKPSKYLTYFSIGGLGLLLGFMFVIGLLSLKWKIAVSTLPFLVVAVLTVVLHQKNKIKKTGQ